MAVLALPNKTSKAVGISLVAFIASTSVLPASSQSFAAEAIQSPAEIPAPMAAAVTAKQLSASGITVTNTEESARYKLDMAFDFTGQDVQPGDYFTVSWAPGNAQTFSEPNTLNGQQVIPIGTFDELTNHSGAGNPADWVSLIYPKTVVQDLNKVSWNTNPFPATIEKNGVVLFTSNVTTDGTRKYVATDAVKNMTNISGTAYSYIDKLRPGGGSYFHYALTIADGVVDNVTQDTLIFSDGTKLSDYRNQLVKAQFTPIGGVGIVPTSIYINDNKVTTMDKTYLNISAFNKFEEYRNIAATSTSTFRQNAVNTLEGVVQFKAPRAAPEQVGKEVLTKVSISADNPYFKMMCNVEPSKIDYKLLPAKWVENPKSPDKTPSLVDLTASEQAAAYPGGVLFNTTTNNAYQLKVVSCDEDSYTVSWVPQAVGDSIELIGSTGFPMTMTPLAGNSRIKGREENVQYNLITVGNVDSNGAYIPASEPTSRQLDGAKSLAYNNVAANTQYYISWNGAAPIFNTIPVASPDASLTEFNTPVTSNVIANDTFPDGAFKSSTVTVEAKNGKVTVNGDGTMTYTPNPGFVGDDVVTYKNTDANNIESNETTWSISVQAPNPPIAQDDIFFTEFNGDPIVFDIVANDTVPAGSQIDYTKTVLDYDEDDNFTYKVVNDGKSVEATPKQGRTGTAPSVGYTIGDIYGSYASATITGNISAPETSVDIESTVNGKKSDTVVPGKDVVVTHKVTNTSKYTYKAGTVVEVTGADGATIQHEITEDILPGESYSFDTVYAIGAKISSTITDSITVSVQAVDATTGEDRSVTASDTSDVTITALSSEISLSDDSAIINKGGEVTGDLFTNDKQNPDYPFLDETFKWILPDGVKGSLSDDGKTITLDNAVISYNGNGKYTVKYLEGATDFVIPTVQYTVTNLLEDEASPASLKVKYSSVDIEVEVKDNDGNWQDADDKDKPVAFDTSGEKTFRYTIANDGQVDLTSLIVKDSNGDSVELKLPERIAPGATVTLVVVKNVDEGIFSENYTVNSDEGAVDTDAVNVKVDIPEPEVVIPEPTPTVEPTPVPTPTPTEEVVTPTPEASTPVKIITPEPVKTKNSVNTNSNPMDNGVGGSILGGIVGLLMMILSALGIKKATRKSEDS